MQVLILIKYTGEAEKAKGFAEEMLKSGIVEDIRSQPGNLSYDYFVPLEDPDSVLLVDRWVSQAALDAHHASDVMQQIMALRDRFDLHMEVLRLLVEDDVIPIHDAGFIRT